MSNRNRIILLSVIILAPGLTSTAQESKNPPTTADRPQHGESAQHHEHNEHPPPEIEPAVPEGMTLDQVFDYAESPPPADYPATLMDDELFIFTLVERFEYRAATESDVPDHFGWEAQGWIGRDFEKFWWKSEGEAVFDGRDKAETETDLLYSRLITPFWNFQIGAQYANEWDPDEYHDRWSGVIALQGLAPYKFEIDNSLYISEHGDFTYALEAEYNLRLTQRTVLQPRAEMGVAFQDIPERGLGAGVTDAKLDLRLRYEIKREFAPYVGVQYRTLFGETEDIAEAANEDTDQLYLLAGLRFAF